MRVKILSKVLVLLVVLDLGLFLIYKVYLSGPKCVHLPRKYCSKGRVIKVKGYKGQEFEAVAYRLPAGTPLFAPVKADLHISSSPAFILTVDGKQVRRQGVMLFKANEKGKIEYIISFIFAFNPAKSQIRQVKQGEKIGQVGDEPVWQKYNLLVTVSTFDKKKRMFVDNQDLIDKFILNFDGEK